MCSIKKAILKNFDIFRSNHMCWGLVQTAASLNATPYICSCKVSLSQMFYRIAGLKTFVNFAENICSEVRYFSKVGITLSIKPQSQEIDSLETRAELAVLHIYVENQAILELIPLYRASKCKQIKEQGSEDCLWTHIFTFL